VPVAPAEGWWLRRRATIEELAKREKVNRGYISRVLRLTLLAPEIVEAILDGRQPAELQLDDLLDAFPLGWKSQRWELISVLHQTVGQEGRGQAQWNNRS
jgi:hypothetical protein